MPNDNQYSNGPEKAKDGSLRESGAGGRVLGGTKFVVGSIIIAGIALVLVVGKMALETYEGQVNLITENIQRLENKLSKYSEADLNSAESRLEFEKLKDHVEILDKQFARLDKILAETKNSYTGDRGWEGKYRRVATQIDALQHEVRALREVSPSNQFLLGGALLTLSRLRANLIQGKSCTTELEVMRSFIEERQDLIDSVDVLSLACEKGVPTEIELQQTFPVVARAIMRTNDMPSDGVWWERFSRILTDLVSIRPVGPHVPGQNPAALVARAEVFLASGDLSGALTTIKKLEVVDGVALEWTEGLAARILAVGQIDNIADVLVASTMKEVANSD